MLTIELGGIPQDETLEREKALKEMVFRAVFGVTKIDMDKAEGADVFTTPKLQCGAPGKILVRITADRSIGFTVVRSLLQDVSTAVKTFYKGHPSVYGVVGHVTRTEDSELWFDSEEPQTLS